jgi:hypothetical protein
MKPKTLNWDSKQYYKLIYIELFKETLHVWLEANNVFIEINQDKKHTVNIIDDKEGFDKV